MVDQYKIGYKANIGKYFLVNPSGNHRKSICMSKSTTEGNVKYQINVTNKLWEKCQ